MAKCPTCKGSGKVTTIPEKLVIAIDQSKFSYPDKEWLKDQLTSIIEAAEEAGWVE